MSLQYILSRLYWICNWFCIFHDNNHIN
ncbi:hypothetical protein ACQ27_gp515 [Klebsiella phage K64-1]|nr:hypothetical protein ACQ27_gp515 [Klebsiella phage K64-1]